MSGTTDGQRKYLNYPDPKCGPDVPFKVKKKENPAVRGPFLPASVFLLESFGLVRKLVWKNAGFGNLRNIRYQIEDYEPRFDPTVTPVENPFNDVDSETPATIQTPSAKLATRYYSVADFQNLYASGEMTPTDVVLAILPLIRRDTTPPGEYSTGFFRTRVDLVLKAAEESTLRWKEKRTLGPLDGVPTAVKDEYDVDGYKTTLGSANDYTNKTLQPEDSLTSWCVRKLEDAGAINLGKLSMHEFGLDTSGNNPIYGTPLNPWNPKYFPGGSSSGCAYAVSSGLVPIALGGDGGGSIRIPSSFCGVYGLKPTHGRLSFWPAVNHAITCAVNGPIAADVASLSAMYRVLGAPDHLSHFPAPSLRAPLPSYKGKKVLGIPEAWVAQSTPAIQTLFHNFINRLVSEHDYILAPITIPFLPEGQIAHAVTMLTDAATLLPKTKGLTAANRVMIALGTVTPSTDYLLAQKLRRCLMQHMAYLWKTHPGMIIVTPTTSCAGWPIKTGDLKFGVSDGDRTLQTMEYVWMANFLGMPSLSVPMGFVVPVGAPHAGDIAALDTPGKIPVGLMAMGEWAAEEELLWWAAECEGLNRAPEGVGRGEPPSWVDVIARAREAGKDAETVVEA